VTEAAQEAITEAKQAEKVTTPVYIVPDPNQEPDAEGRVVLKDPDQVVCSFLYFFFFYLHDYI